MILPILLFAVSPEPSDEYPELPSPCHVEWGGGIGSRFAEGTTPRIERRCREFVDVLDEEIAPGSIRVEIGGETAAFTVSVVLLDDNGVPQHREEPDGEICECGSDDLATFAIKRVAAALESRHAPQSEVTEPPDTHEEPSPDAPPKKHRKIGPLGTVGAVVMGVGTAGVITGAILLPRPNRSEPVESSFLTLDRTSYRTPAISAIALGGAALVGGTAMLVTDLVRRKRAHKKSAYLMPTITQQAASLSLAGRF